MKTNETVKERLLQFIANEGLTIKEVERKCGMSNASIRNSRGGFGIDKIELILEQFPKMNRDWLLFGDGSMLIEGQNNNIGNIVNDAGHDNFFTSTKEDEYKSLLAERDMRIAELEKQIESLKADKAFQQQIIVKLMEK